MMSVLVIAGEFLFVCAFGWAVLSLHPHSRHAAETLLASLLLGMFVTTMSAGALMFLGLSLQAAGIATALIMAGVIAVMFNQRKPRPVAFSLPRLKWYEWATLAAVVEQVAFVLWQLLRSHTYFADALTHWSGRARAMFGGVNWSFDPASPFFMGKHIGYASYPLHLVIWRALSAKLNGGWNEIISRADGLIFFMVILGTIWLAVRRLSNSRGLAAAAAFVVSAAPLHVWHAAAGYADIAVEAYVLASLAALLRREWILAGLLAAGAAWSKNDALVLYLPALICAVLLLERRSIGRFLLGFSAIAPWLVFNVVHRLGLSPEPTAFAWHADAPAKLWNAVVDSPNGPLLWIAVAGCLLYSGRSLFNDAGGRALIVASAAAAACIAFTFAMTSAYAFLANEMTVHRVLMQCSGIAVLTASYGFWLKTQSAEPRVRRQARGRTEGEGCRG